MERIKLENHEELVANLISKGWKVINIYFAFTAFNASTFMSNKLHITNSKFASEIKLIAAETKNAYRKP